MLRPGPWFALQINQACHCFIVLYSTEHSQQCAIRQKAQLVATGCMAKSTTSCNMLYRQMHSQLQQVVGPKAHSHCQHVILEIPRVCYIFTNNNNVNAVGLMMSWVRAGQVLSIQSSLSCLKLILYILLCHLPQQLLQVLARCASCHSLIVFKGMIKPGRQRVLFQAPQP